MAHAREGNGSSNTAIVAIVVLILVAVVAFMVFFWNAGEPEAPADGPDIELQVNPPEGGGGEGGGGEGGNP